MTAEVIKVEVPIGNGLAMSAYRVELDQWQVLDYHETVTRKATYGVYEHEAIANYVADEINHGRLKPYLEEVNHTYPED